MIKKILLVTLFLTAHSIIFCSEALKGREYYIQDWSHFDNENGTGSQQFFIVAFPNALPDEQTSTTVRIYHHQKRYDQTTGYCTACHHAAIIRNGVRKAPDCTIS